jgi:hypothetical protein
MRPFLFCALAASVCFAAEDAREIVRRSVNVGDQNLKAARNYTYRERSEGRSLDHSGRVSKTEIEVHDITVLEGSPYKRLISRDDKPLPPGDERKEEEKLLKITAERRKETPAQREKRLADYDRKREHERATWREIVDAFDFRQAGDDHRDGRDQYVIEAVPHPGYKPRTRYAAFFPKVKGKIWIDKQDYHWSRVEANVIDTISFGAFLVRLAKGAHLEADQTHVNGEVWLPKRLRAEASARVALVKTFHGQLEITYSDYKKFQTDSRIVSAAPVE